MLSLALAIISLSAFATPVKRVKSDIRKVTVFLNKAQIVADAAAELEAGNTDVKIIKLPANLDAQSINVSGKGNFTILSVQYNINYIQSAEKSKEAESLEDTVAQLEYEIGLLNN
ncbi:MAG: DUF4140 domain-containing protein, partial [Cytophagales bacterium]|nr:DUF4140 domain-containing protein [Cytophagales bacterium]